MEMPTKRALLKRERPAHRGVNGPSKTVRPNQDAIVAGSLLADSVPNWQGEMCADHKIGGLYT